MMIRASLLTVLLCLIYAGTIASVTVPSQTAAAQSTQLYLPSISNNVCGSFFDTFDSPTSGWITGQYGDLRAEIANGEYILSFTSAGMVWLVPGPVCQHSTYRAAVDVHWAGDTGNFAGLLFNLDDNTQNGFLFAINTDDRVWLVLEVVGGSIRTVISPVGNDAILPGNAVNRLAVERLDQSVVLFINGTTVGAMPDNQPGKHVIAGVSAASYTTQQQAEARFDNFHYEGIGPLDN